MRVSVLIDNEAQEGLACEWGLSLLIEHRGTVVLLDAGATDAFSRNAQAMAVDLGTVDAAVLSHAHFDHSGGMAAFLDQNDRAPLYLAAAAEADCWSDSKGELAYIGIAPKLLADYHERLVRVDNPTSIAPGIWALPHTTPGLEQEGKAQGMYLKRGDCFVADPFAHEITLVLESEGGLTVATGCSHSRPDVILEEVRSTFPGKAVDTLVGGLHLYDRSSEETAAFAQRLKDAAVDRVITGHCTGDAYGVLLDELGPSHVGRFKSGAVFEL